MTRSSSPPDSSFALAAISAVISAKSTSPESRALRFPGEPVEAFKLKRSPSSRAVIAAASSEPFAYMLPPASAVPTVSQVAFEAFRPCTAQAENKHKKTRESAIAARFFLAANPLLILQLLSGF
jgi:hypothetical protein